MRISLLLRTELKHLINRQNGVDVKKIIVVEGKPEASLELPQKLGVGSIVVEDRP